MFERTHDALPAGARPTLMVDRGLCWPAVVDFCVGHGWHFLLRAQGQTRVKMPDGREQMLADLAPRRRRAGAAGRRCSRAPAGGG